MDVVRVLKENNITPKKEMDQFFLKDERIIEEEVMAADLKSSDVVLEIGCGLGNLTRKLAEKCRVIGVEKDYSFHSLLKIPNTNIIFGDALEVLESLRVVAEKRGNGEFNKIVSNIPYSISQDLLIEILQHRFDAAVMIVQKEFAEKLGEDKLGMALSECASVRVIREVPASAFYPEAVQSSLILIKQKNKLAPDFWRFLCSVYRGRNKNVSNAVKNTPLTIAKKKVHQLTLEEMKALYEMNKK